MGNMPSDRDALLKFALGHQDKWSSNAVSIGLTAPQMVALKAAVAAVQAQQTTVETIRAQSKTATRALGDNFTTLRRDVSDAVRDINAFAAASAKPETVFNLADIEPPQPRGETLPPAKPTNLTFTLDPATGGIQIKWKCSNPQGVFGVVYTVRRRIGANGSQSVLGVTGEKKFTDTTIPAGTSLLTYEVFGQRGSQVGPTSDTVQVRFGVGANGEMTVASVKMAA